MSEETDPKNPPRFMIILGAVVLFCVIIGGVYFSVGPDRFASLWGTSGQKTKQQAGKGTAQKSDQNSNASKGVQIGGPFQLMDHTGVLKTEKDFVGKFTLIYFGYTYCPDVCPTTLTTMTDALKSLGSKADRITPIFITVDPKRDTVEHLRMYVSHFHPRLIGLTGTDAQVAKAAKVFRVYFAKQKGAKPEDVDYLVDHSSIVYLMDQKGRYLSHFGHAVTAEAMAERIQKHL